jgi:hypothetical protein
MHGSGAESEGWFCSLELANHPDLNLQSGQLRHEIRGDELRIEAWPTR